MCVCDYVIKIIEDYLRTGCIRNFANVHTLLRQSAPLSDPVSHRFDFTLSVRPRRDKVMAHGKIHIIKNKNDWEEKLAEGKSKDQVVVVDFTATWCGPCKFIAPFFAELSEKYDNVIFLKVDVDELSDISTEYEVHAMPTFLFLKKSEVVDKLVGINKSELEKKVKHFSESSAAVVKQFSESSVAAVVG